MAESNGSMSPKHWLCRESKLWSPAPMLPGVRIGRQIYDMPILADGVVRFIGEKVAAVAAETEEIAEQALDQIDVEYEEFSPLLDPVESLAPGATLLHPQVMALPGTARQACRRRATPSSSCPGKRATSKKAFDAPTWLLRIRFKRRWCTRLISSRTRAWSKPTNPAAPRSGLAAKCLLRCATKWRPLSALPRRSFWFIRATSAAISGARAILWTCRWRIFFRCKSRRPVKMVMDYDDEFIAGNPRHASIVKVKTGVFQQTAASLPITWISSSIAAPMARSNRSAICSAPMKRRGPYRMENVLIEEKIVYTNKVPCGHMRAPGDPQGVFANESQMDLIAKELRMDPARFRRMNLMQDGDESPVGRKISHIKARETLDRLLKRVQVPWPQESQCRARPGADSVARARRRMFGVLAHR